MRVKRASRNGDDQTLLTVGDGTTFDNNFNDFIFRNVAIDGATDDPVLVNINTNPLASRGSIRISITGSIQNEADYTVADLVKGDVRPTDRIYINFSGTTGAVIEDFNSQSTVDASGRFISSGEFDAP